MNNDPKQIAKLWLSQFDERLAWLDQQMDEMTPEDLISISTALDERRKALANYLSEMEQRVAKRMGQQAIKNAVVPALDGGTLSVEYKPTSRRTEVRRDELVQDVERAANADQHRLDPATGEVRSVYETRNLLLKRCFRMEPRWTELTKLGIDIDEYANTEWVSTVKVTKAASL